MTECNSYETNNVYPNLKPALLDNQQFRLNWINEIKDYFIAEIKEREKDSLIVLSVTTGSISIASFATVTGAPVGIVSASFSLEFLISTGIIKTLLKTTSIRRKNIIKLLC